MKKTNISYLCTRRRRGMALRRIAQIGLSGILPTHITIIGGRVSLGGDPHRAAREILRVRHRRFFERPAEGYRPKVGHPFPARGKGQRDRG